MQHWSGKCVSVERTKSEYDNCSTSGLHESGGHCIGSWGTLIRIHRRPVDARATQDGARDKLDLGGDDGLFGSNFSRGSSNHALHNLRRNIYESRSRKSRRSLNRRSLRDGGRRTDGFRFGEPFGFRGFGIGSQELACRFNLGVRIGLEIRRLGFGPTVDGLRVGVGI